MDLAIVSWVAEHLHNPFLDWLMPMITRLTDLGLIWILICLALLARPKTRRDGICCAVALLLMLFLGEGLLKHLFERPRPYTHLPDLQLLIPPETSFSFPSSHTTAAFAGAVSLRLMDKRLGSWALALAFLTAFSRLYLSVHYVTDILAGMLLGTFCAVAARWLCAQFWKWRERHNNA